MVPWSAHAKSLIASLGCVFLALGCQAFVNSTPGAGIGASCSKDEECEASKCIQGICTISCSSNDVCPAPTSCKGGTCQLPLRAAFVYSFDPNVQQSTRAQELGRQQVMKDLVYLATDARPNNATSSAAVDAAKTFVTSGYKLIVTDEPTYGDAIAQIAKDLPQASFLTCGSRNTGNTYGSYYGRMYQAFYLAGYGAATVSTKKRLGIVGSYITPNVVQALNAYVLGARAVDPSTVVEVRWVGFWHDQNPPNTQGKSLEVVDTEALVADGADVIADTTDSNYVVTRIASTTVLPALTGIKSIGYNVKDACGGKPSCLGAAFWNWGALFRTMLSDIHQSGIPDDANYEGGLALDENEAVVGFNVNAPAGAPQTLATKISDQLGQIVKGDNRFPFRGPICSTGQRMGCLSDGDFIDWSELGNMCWFVDGMVEKTNPADPTSADKPAQVPMMGDCASTG